MIFFPIVIGSRSRRFFLCEFLIKPWFFIFERSWWFKIFSFFLFFVFLLNFFDDVIIFEILFRNFYRQLFESFLSNTKAWLFDNQVRILFFLFDNFCGNIKVVNAVGWRRRICVWLSDSFSVSNWFENCIWAFLVNYLLRVIWSWARLIISQKIFVFASCFSWSKLASVSSLNFIN